MMSKVRRTISLAILCASMMILSTTIVNADNATDTIADMSDSGDIEESPTLLFVQTASGAEMKRGILTLFDVANTTVYFTDRPYKFAGTRDTISFMDQWVNIRLEERDIRMAPNAAIVCDIDGVTQTNIFTLYLPNVIDTDTGNVDIMFRARPVGDTPIYYPNVLDTTLGLNMTSYLNQYNFDCDGNVQIFIDSLRARADSGSDVNDPCSCAGKYGCGHSCHNGADCCSGYCQEDKETGVKKCKFACTLDNGCCPDVPVVKGGWTMVGSLYSGLTLTRQEGNSYTSSISTETTSTIESSIKLEGMDTASGEVKVTDSMATTIAESSTSSITTGITVELPTIYSETDKTAYLWQWYISVNENLSSDYEVCKVSGKSAAIAWTSSSASPPICPPDTVCVTEGTTACDYGDQLDSSAIPDEYIPASGETGDCFSLT